MPRKAIQRPVQKTYTPDLLLRDLQDAYRGDSPQNLSVRELARRISRKTETVITYGTLARAIKGIEPRDDMIRHALGLPCHVLVAVCPDCGEPHIRKTCPARHSERAGRRRVRYSAAQVDALVRAVLDCTIGVMYGSRP